MNATQCYRILCLSPGATQEQIKKSYRELASQWHPDKYGHDPEAQEVALEKIKEINAANDFLKVYQTTPRASNPVNSETKRSHRETDSDDRNRREETRRRTEEEKRRAAEEDRRRAAEETVRRRRAEAQAAEEARAKRTQYTRQAQGHSTHVVTYTYSRLCFKAKQIEPLQPNEAFRVITPDGTFQMTKAEFYSSFPGVVASKSYVEKGLYHFPSVPQKAMKYKVQD